MLNAIRCIDTRFVFKNYGILCLALLFDLSNLRMTILHAKKLVQVARYNKVMSTFFSSYLICTYCSVVGASQEQRVRQLVFDPCWMLKLSSFILPFCVALSLSVH